VRDQSGQATIEWLGLVLMAALALGGLAAFATRGDEQGLGRALAQRWSCAARGACVARGGGAAARAGLWRPGAGGARARSAPAGSPSGGFRSPSAPGRPASGGARPRSAPARPPAGGARPPTNPGRPPSGGARPRSAPARPPSGGARPRSAPGRSQPPVPRDRAIDAFRRLRTVGKLGQRLWIVCLGYRRYIYERDHPLPPTQAIPLDEALDIANACLNPAAFFTDD
jgi:hypothetical protein